MQVFALCPVALCAWTRPQGHSTPRCNGNAIEGLSRKVLSERLDKLVRFGILHKASFAEIPPRVEYSLTPFGEKFAKILDELEKLQKELS